MNTNTLVTSPKFQGIGCVARVLKHTCVVNYGSSDCMKLKYTDLSEVDVSMCATITFDALQRGSMVNSSEMPTKVILGNMVKQYVGIGWVGEKVVKVKHLTKYPRVIH